MADIEKRFGKVIRKLREKKHLSQEAFADQAGIDRSYQGRIERGEQSVTLRTMETLSKALNTPLSAFMIELEKMDDNTTSD